MSFEQVGSERFRADGISELDRDFRVLVISSDPRLPEAMRGVFDVNASNEQQLVFDASELPWLSLTVAATDGPRQGPARFESDCLEATEDPTSLPSRTTRDLLIRFDRAPYVIPLPVSGRYRVRLLGGPMGRTVVSESIVFTDVGTSPVQLYAMN